MANNQLGYRIVGTIESQPGRTIQYKFDNRDGIEMHVGLGNQFPSLISGADGLQIVQWLDAGEWERVRDLLKARGITHLHVPTPPEAHRGEPVPIDQATPWSAPRRTRQQIARESRRR